ncbi:Hypothetical protein J6896_02619 [Nakaseomyces glabratus]
MSACHSNQLQSLSSKTHTFTTRTRAHNYEHNHDRISNPLEREFLHQDSIYDTATPVAIPIQQPRQVPRDTKKNTQWLSEFQQLSISDVPSVKPSFTRPAPTSTFRIINNDVRKDSLFKFQEHPIIDRLSPEAREDYYNNEFEQLEKELENDDDVQDGDQFQDLENKTYEYYNEFAFNDQSHFQQSARDILNNMSNSTHEYSSELNEKLSGSTFVNLLKSIDIGDVSLQDNRQGPKELKNSSDNTTLGNKYADIPDYILE